MPRFIVSGFLCCCATLLCSVAALGQGIQVHYAGDVLTVENSVIRRQFSTRDEFHPISFLDKKTGVEALRAARDSWFEVGVNGDVLDTARYVRHETRKMAHGGVEVRVLLRTGPLRADYLLRIFPGSPVTRERLEFRAGDAAARFSKIGGKVRLLFPRYRFRATERAEEIRLASWNREQVPDADGNAFPAGRAWGSANGRGLNLSQCHMFHPAFLEFSPTTAASRKGPIFAGLLGSGTGWLLACEHGSPDDDPERDFLRVVTRPAGDGLTVAVSAQNGAYLDGQPVPKDEPYRTVWVDAAVFTGSDFDAAHAVFWKFLYYWQSEQPATRRPVFYYNTWGWQRDDSREYVNFNEIQDTRPGTDVYGDPQVYPPLTYYNVSSPGGRRKNLSPRDVLQKNEERLLLEIDYAHQIGAGVFVFARSRSGERKTGQVRNAARPVARADDARQTRQDARPIRRLPGEGPKWESHHRWLGPRHALSDEPLPRLLC